MYTGHGFNEWGIGDIDVVKVGDTYHLFHLFLPNHAYIAHAVSTDGLTWTRVQNALFVGHPGSWDDDMLWTMHVTPDPDRPGSWRMFYTGLARREAGRIQRIGLAVSDDLYTWRRAGEGFPISAAPEHYESSPEEGRGWVSFRDPYFCRVGEERWLLASGRVNTGPVIRRGCVALAREVGARRFEFGPPLHFPRLYDDVEVPCLFELDGQWYLLGSIREDVKVHYWYAERPEGPFGNYFDNVLLPRGNYAARVCREDGRYTLWNFYYLDSKIKGTGNMLPPPKEIFTGSDGQLKLRSFSGFDQKVVKTYTTEALAGLGPVHHNPAAEQTERGLSFWLSCETSFETFLLPEPQADFRLRATFELAQLGKCGLVLRMSDETDGYFISLDLVKGLIQARASGRNPGGGIEEAFIFKNLQANYFVAKRDGLRYEMQLIAYGRYIEFSLDGEVLLTFADDRYRSGHIGYYTEGARLRIDRLELDVLTEPRGELHAEPPMLVGPAEPQDTGVEHG
jgi:beta-fructofuranosidase